MAIMGISLGLQTEKFGYGDLWAGLRGYPSWCIASEWLAFVQTDQNIGQVRDFASAYLDRNDQIVVFPAALADGFAGYGLVRSRFLIGCRELSTPIRLGPTPTSFASVTTSTRRITTMRNSSRPLRWPLRGAIRQSRRRSSRPGQRPRLSGITWFNSFSRPTLCSCFPWTLAAGVRPGDLKRECGNGFRRNMIDRPRECNSSATSRSSKSSRTSRSKCMP